MESVLKLEQSTALSKDWYVYYKFIDDSGNWNACPILKLEQIDTKQKEKLQILIPLGML
jgi:hypothetical protein